jgi:hypothetical protein
LDGEKWRNLHVQTFFDASQANRIWKILTNYETKVLEINEPADEYLNRGNFFKGDNPCIVGCLAEVHLCQMTVSRRRRKNFPMRFHRPTISPTTASPLQRRTHARPRHQLISIFVCWPAARFFPRAKDAGEEASIRSNSALH